jgi:hypothetical protein
MSEQLEQLSKQFEGSKDPSNPPVHLWHPALSGDIDILILRDGTWLHEGRPIERDSLVRLFASILRREDDGDYYLVTPVEKWRLRVECLPLLIIDFSLEEAGTAQQRLRVHTNTGREFEVGEAHPLFIPTDDGVETTVEGVPAVALDNGLAALFSRAAWYRLVELGEDTEQGFGLFSQGHFYILG